jgi:hypothetical protein
MALRMVWLVLLMLCAEVVPSYAAPCPGSGLAFSCPSGTTIGTVNDTITAGNDGMVITFAAGTYNWSSGTISLSNSKGTTLICITNQACSVTQSTNTMIELAFSGTNTKFYRISGFDFTSASVCGTCIWFWGNGTLHGSGLGGFRIDHNRWTGYNSSLADAAALVFLGSNGTSAQCSGVIDHNTVVSAADNMIVKNWCGYNNSYTTQNNDNKGAVTNTFVENNTFSITDGGSSVACMDAGVNHSTVVRYNTTVNCRGFDTHGMPHGGVNNFELYRNDMTKNAGGFLTGYRLIHNQGAGQYIIWDNVFTVVGTIHGSAISLIHYRDNLNDTPGSFGQCDGTKSWDGNTSPVATYRGWPCLNQPGRKEAGGTPQWGKLSPVIVWLNRTNGGTKVNLAFDCPWTAPEYCAQHIVPERDYYDAVSATANTCTSPPGGGTCSPFNGTVGIGHGTLENRPNACTHNTAPDGDNGGGVMYWATDQGSWNTSGDGRGSGVLYRCSATNTWTVHYTPYTYPHPLVSGGVPPDTTPPAAPTGIMISRSE